MFAIIAPEFGLYELSKYEWEILRKSGLTKMEYDLLLSSLLERITVIPKTQYSAMMSEAEKIMGSIDLFDIPFIALALGVSNDGIWSDDHHFRQQNRIRTYTTQELSIQFKEHLL